MKVALPRHISPSSQNWPRNGTKKHFNHYNISNGIVNVQTKAVTSSAVGNTVLHNWLVGAPETIQILFAAATAYAVAATVWMLIIATRGFLEGRKVQQGYYSETMLAGSFPQAPPLGPMITPLILIYGWMLFHSYEPDMLSLILPGSLEEGFKGGFNPQFFPKVAGIATLFSRLTTAASLWVHLLCINLFAAHSILKQGTVLYYYYVNYDYIMISLVVISVLVSFHAPVMIFLAVFGSQVLLLGCRRISVCWQP